MTYQELPGDRISVPSTGTPACLLTWVDRPGGGIRLYASRTLHSLKFGQRTDDNGGDVHWHVATTMTGTLIKDADTPAEAIRWVLERWAREDAERLAEAVARVERLRQHAIAGMSVNDPKAITNTGGGSIL